MSDKPYAPPPNMQVPYGMDSKAAGAQQPPQAAYPPQAGFAPYGYASTNMPPPPADMHVPIHDTDPIVKGFQFNTETIRRGFIRKVYSILSVQLLFTFLVVMACVHHDGTKHFAIKNIGWLFPVTLILVFVTIITLSCCEGVRRTSPTNMIFLSLFTIGESIMVGMATINYPPDTVMIAVGLTAVVVIALTVFAFQTKWDFTMLGGVLFAALWLMILTSFLMMFWRNHVAELVFSSIGALLFCAYLIHDTQLIMGGNHKFSMSPEEYILGAITLFLDIINIFLYILRILGAASKN
ncbi:protein lifeguard 1-like [Sitodiplosis mosellana]|uniref:protein lifeguard 1-like n=1 Tax=Sitodiplosis mosellana TaxID=263140 RepID=UPI0024439B39|nr:protein lifeguard 1-like [Sitodiplosis mosellana]